MNIWRLRKTIYHPLQVIDAEAEEAINRWKIIRQIARK